MSSEAIERRVAPRFAVNRVGELASGTDVVPVSVSDMSVTGCGIEVAGDVAGTSGILSVYEPGSTGSAVLLPVTVSNRRLDGGVVRLGLQFRRLDMRQMRGLIGLLDDRVRRKDV